jgi:hypothetical protein
MINLLPPEYKKEIIQEENWKLIMTWGMLVLVFLICFSLILFSIKIFISGEVEAQKILFKQKEKELQTPQMQSLQHNLTAFNQTLFQLNYFYQNQFKITETLEKISTVFHSGTYLTNLSINHSPQKEGDYQANCNLSGFSSTREKLLKLKENLEKEESFIKIDFPPTNWTKATNINFTVNFKLK